MPDFKLSAFRPSRTSLILPVVSLVSFLAAGCRPTAEPQAAKVSDAAWAVVDGREITRQEVEKAYERMRDPAQPVSDEEALAAKLGLLNELIVQDILVAKARALKVELPDTELETAYAEAKKNITEEEFKQELAKRSLTPDEMREGLRREMLAQKVIEREVGAKVTVTDQEVTDFFNANKAQFNVPEEGYRIAQIVITPVREPQVTNRTEDDAATPQAAQTKAAMLMEKLKGGASFGELATDYSEDPESATRGGDLGLVPMSRLKQAPPQLRDAVLKKTPGTATLVSAGGAHTIVLVVSHEPAGQRDLSTPGMRERITETLRARKEQLLRTAYLTDVRGDAAVVNVLAQRIVDSQGKLP